MMVFIALVTAAGVSPAVAQTPQGREKSEGLRSWHPEDSFTPGEEWEGRTVLAELFTGSECPPCVASDLAYDAILAYYPDDVVAVLEYHLHIPGPDPMTNEDAEARQAYYEGAIRGTPTSVINGMDISVGGGPDVAAKSRFGLYQWSISEAMHGAPPLAIDLSGGLDGQTVSMEASVAWTGQPLEGDWRLRVGLAEKEVRYTGANGVSEHKMVVRKLLGGPDGWAVQEVGTTTASAEIDIAERERQLMDYLTAFEEQHPDRFRGAGGFSAKKHEIDEDELVLVAFVQNDTTLEVIEAAVFELP